MVNLLARHYRNIQLSFMGMDRTESSMTSSFFPLPRPPVEPAWTHRLMKSCSSFDAVSLVE